MIDTDKYEGLTIDDWYKMNHHDWKDVVNEYDDLLAEVKRLREVMIYVEQMQPHPALEWALKEGLTLTEIKKVIE